jgi:hypothetical protein
MFNLTKFWLGTAAYVVIIGAVIAAACVIFASFVGKPADGEAEQFATQPASIPDSKAESVQDSKATPAEIKPAVAAPSAAPMAPVARRKPATSIAEAIPPLRTTVPDLQIIVPEPRSNRRGSSSR